MCKGRNIIWLKLVALLLGLVATQCNAPNLNWLMKTVTIWVNETNVEPNRAYLVRNIDIVSMNLRVNEASTHQEVLPATALGFGANTFSIPIANNIFYASLIIRNPESAQPKLVGSSVNNNDNSRDSNTNNNARSGVNNNAGQSDNTNRDDNAVADNDNQQTSDPTSENQPDSTEEKSSDDTPFPSTSAPDSDNANNLGDAQLTQHPVDRYLSKIHPSGTYYYYTLQTEKQIATNTEQIELSFSRENRHKITFIPLMLKITESDHHPYNGTLYIQDPFTGGKINFLNPAHPKIQIIDGYGLSFLPYTESDLTTFTFVAENDAQFPVFTYTITKVDTDRGYVLLSNLEKESLSADWDQDGTSNQDALTANQFPFSLDWQDQNLSELASKNDNPPASTAPDPPATANKNTQDLITGHCNKEMYAGSQTNILKICLEYINFPTKKSHDESYKCEAADEHGRAGVWNDGGCDTTEATASCKTQSGQTALNIYVFDPAFNQALNTSEAGYNGICNSEATYTEISNPVLKRASVTVMQQDTAILCLELTDMPATMEAGLQQVFVPENSGNIWTLDGTCPHAGVQATCSNVKNSGGFTQSTFYYIQFSDQNQTDCAQSEGTWNAVLPL